MNTGSKFGLIGGGIIAAIILVLVITNTDEPLTSDVEEFSGESEITNMSIATKINTECELVNYLNDEENLTEVLSYVQTHEEQFQTRYLEAGGVKTMLSQDSREVVTDEEIAKIVFAEMVIEEFSINPELKDFLIIIQEDSPQQVIDRVKQIDPNCEIKEGTLNRTSQPISSPPGAGTLGSDHSHAAILVKIFGDSFDFSVPAYQIQASWIHFEAGEGSTIHKHATGVTLGYLFESLRLGLDDQCFVFKDGRSFCTNEDYSLKFFINGEQIGDIREYEIMEGDRILVSYGDESSQEIESQLSELEAQQILN